MNKNILLALLASAYAFAATPEAATAANATTTAEALRYDFDTIARMPNALNDFTPAQLIELKKQLTAVQATRGQGFGAFDAKLERLQGYVAQRLTGTVLAVAFEALPTVRRPKAGDTVINMFEVTIRDLANPEVRAAFKNQLNELKAKGGCSYDTQPNTKAKTDQWLAWLATQDTAAAAQ